jgi:hypothetical protein
MGDPELMGALAIIDIPTIEILDGMGSMGWAFGV